MLRITIPANAQTVDTEVITSYTKAAAKTADAGTHTVQTTTTTVDTTTSTDRVPTHVNGESTTRSVENTKTTGPAPKTSTPAVASPYNALGATGTAFNATTDNVFRGVVANFRDTNPSTATVPVMIDWGDNTPASPGTVSLNAQGSRISGSHTYTRTGLFSTQITIPLTGGPPPVVVFGQANVSVPPPPANHECDRRKVIDIHVATSNGISNHLFVEVSPSYRPTDPTKAMKTSVTTQTLVNATTGETTTNTDYTTTSPGIVLPPGTILPMGTSLPSGGTFVSPGAATINNLPSGYQPGTVPSNFYQPMPPTPAPATGPGAMNAAPTPASEALADRNREPELAPIAENAAPAGAVLPGDHPRPDRRVGSSFRTKGSHPAAGLANFRSETDTRPATRGHGTRPCRGPGRNLGAPEFEGRASRPGRRPRGDPAPARDAAGTGTLATNEVCRQDRGPCHERRSGHDEAARPEVSPVTRLRRRAVTYAAVDVGCWKLFDSQYCEKHQFRCPGTTVLRVGQPV